MIKKNLLLFLIFSSLYANQSMSYDKILLSQTMTATANTNIDYQLDVDEKQEEIQQARKMYCESTISSIRFLQLYADITESQYEGIQSKEKIKEMYIVSEGILRNMILFLTDLSEICAIPADAEKIDLQVERLKKIYEKNY